jgi:NifU-like protein involved in Fe-S cluster formation
VSAPLYNRQILALAVENAFYPSLEKARLSGMLRSMVCGSQVHLDMEINSSGAVSALGMEVQACALGQASATLFARHAKGLDYPALRAARDQLLAWLRGQDDAPAWPEFDALMAVKDYPARHSAVLLPFDTAVMLLDGAQP